MTFESHSRPGSSYCQAGQCSAVRRRSRAASQTVGKWPRPSNHQQGGECIFCIICTPSHRDSHAGPGPVRAAGPPGRRPGPPLGGRLSMSDSESESAGGACGLIRHRPSPGRQMLAGPGRLPAAPPSQVTPASQVTATVTRDRRRPAGRQRRPPRPRDPQATQSKPEAQPECALRLGCESRCKCQ